MLVSEKEGTMLGYVRMRHFGFGALLIGASSAVACGREAPTPPAAVEPARINAEGELAVLPNNMTIMSVKNRLIAIRSDGDVAWELSLPEGDSAIAPIAVALNSVAYVRG